MNQLGKLFMANFKMTFREKQVWFWSIFYPVLLLVVFLTFFGGGGDETKFEAKIAVVAGSGSKLAPQLTPILKQIEALQWKEDAPVSLEQAEAWVREKEIDAAIVFPGDDGTRIQLLVNSERQQSVTAQALNGILKEMATQLNYSSAGVVPRHEVAMEFLSSNGRDFSFKDFILTGMIALSIAQAGMFGMVGLVEMRRNGLLKRLMLTPIRMGTFGFSSMLVRFILSAIQVVLLSLIGILFYDASLKLSLFAFIVIFLTGTIAFASIGFLIAALSKSMESYMGIANLISFIMMFISGIFFETGSLPVWIKPISDVLPLTYFVNGIRDTMAYGNGMNIAAFWLNTGVLAAWTIVTFWIGSKLYRWKGDVK